MNRTSLSIGFVITTVVLASASRTFGESKFRGMSGGSNRGANVSQTGQTSRSFGLNKSNLTANNFSGNPLNGNHTNSGNNGSGQGSPNGIKLNGGFNPQNHGIQLPQLGNNQNGQNSGQAKINLPSNLQKKIGHTIQLPNGTKTQTIGINAGQILKQKGSNLQMQGQIKNICGTAPKHLCNQPKFSWWVNVCHEHCHSNYGCWNVNQQYWDCWTPCNWQVVQCQQFSYFVGLSATYIPDMQAYGVQSVISNSPAHLSGLLPGDLIQSVNGQTVFDANLINTEIPRGRLDLQVIREGFATPLQLTVFPRLVQTVSF